MGNSLVYNRARGSWVLRWDQSSPALFLELLKPALWVPPCCQLISVKPSSTPCLREPPDHDLSNWTAQPCVPTNCMAFCVQSTSLSLGFLSWEMWRIMPKHWGCYKSIQATLCDRALQVQNSILSVLIVCFWCLQRPLQP